MRRVIPILVCLVGLVGSNALRADDIYVDNQLGDDLNDGTPISFGSTNSGPLKTISMALKKANMGDRIIIQKTDTPYRESLTLQGTKHSGTSLMPFRLESDGAIIDGTSAVPADAWEHYRENVFRFQPRLMSHQLLYLNGRPAQQVKTQRRGYVPDLEPKQWSLVDGWIYFCTAPDEFPSEYDLSYCRFQTGITLYQVRNVTIAGLIVQGFQLDGINAHDSVSSTQITNCTLRGNGRSGLSVGGACRVRIRECLVGDNNTGQIRSEGFCRLEVESCQLLDAPPFGPPIEYQGGVLSIDGNPHQ